MRTRILWTALCLVATLAAAAAPAAAAGDCTVALAYPGDSEPKAALAQWMASGARARGIPGELPVMGALVESDLSNVSGGDADTAGFFAMRTGIWNTGAYAGFPENPDLQLKWFADQAIAIRGAQIASGDTAYGIDPAGWGNWDADVLRPVEQDRGRYQLRLADARALIGPACAGWPPDPVAPPPPAPAPPPAAAPALPAPAPDTTAPLLQLGGPERQPAVERGALLVTARCPAERCHASATGTLRIPGVRRPIALRAVPREAGRDQRVRLRLPLSPRVRRLARRALHKGATVRATIRVLVSDDAGNRTTRRRTIRVIR